MSPETYFAIALIACVIISIGFVPVAKCTMGADGAQAYLMSGLAGFTFGCVWPITAFVLVLMGVSAGFWKWWRDG